MLAKLHMDTLADTFSPRDLIEALNTLPEKTNDTYELTMQRVGAQNGSVARLANKILSWVVHAFRTLHIEDLRHALAVREDDTDLDIDALPIPIFVLSSCAGLVIIESGSSLVRLVHYTAYEYFRDKGAKHISNAHGGIAATCIHYLSLNGLELSSGAPAERNKGAIQYRLLNYAAYHWGSHILACHAKEAERLAVTALPLLSRPRSLNIIAERLDRDSVPSRHPLRDVPVIWTIMHVLAWCGWEKLMMYVEDQRRLAHGRTNHGQTPLHYAALRGHVSTVRLLLDHYKVWPKQVDKLGISPLDHAMVQYNEELVHTLLSAKDFKDINRWNLSVVAKAQPIIGISERVLSYDRNFPNIFGLLDWTPLLQATFANQAEKVVQLLSNGVEVNTRGWNGETALTIAAYKNNEKMVKILLRTEGINVDVRDKTSRTPLSWAVGKDYGDCQDPVKDGNH